ncbi:RagB/SusD family nutrient uptake outer membrane protein [Sphingobacterium sp. Ka21]|uniref:RagB/SusD family nutrient uptake outer membrane protein n=2 Tax=Sphingobacterium pedocola TaxID=2082722 RepID=A0ABR9TBR6_9SPHI|nr:RagB/SusD family nutrient uptake outer membrane protein [Sphingobacterium pedocola]
MMMKKFIKISLVFLTLQGLSGCNYLDVVPDNVRTIEHSFALRIEAKRYLYTCYSYLPQHGQLTSQSPSFAGFEMWPLAFNATNTSQFVMGQQNVSEPLLNYWEGRAGGKDMFQAIRDCNIFLENIQQVPDMQQPERDQWAAEVKFLKAYYHFFLMQLYGPIPLIKENLESDAEMSEVRVRRQPVDACVDYIVELLDETLVYLPNLPLQQIDRPEYGRINALMARGLKAKVLATAASPLFNGNTDYADYIDPELGPLFNQTYSAEKWQRAMIAAKEAIDNATEIGMKLYEFQPGPTLNLSDTTLFELNIREAFATRDANINGEVIWPNTGGNAQQSAITPRSWSPTLTSASTAGAYGPPLQIVEMFYTDKGLPIEHDKTWDYNGRYDFRIGDVQNNHHVKEGYETIKLHFHREPRFYANIGFDGGIWYGQGIYDDKANFHLEIRGGRYSSVRETSAHSPTGYYPKKPINYQNYLEGSSYFVTSYLFPNMRLTELYLLYAEAANEFSGPSEEVFYYLNAIRTRAGVPTVEESWDLYSNQQGKYSTKGGLQDIIRQERRIELNTESQVYWDLLRWKTAETILSQPILGWDKRGVLPEEFYKLTVIFQRQFRKRDYFMPIREYELQRNENLLQSPGW